MLYEAKVSYKTLNDEGQEVLKKLRIANVLHRSNKRCTKHLATIITRKRT